MLNKILYALCAIISFVLLLVAYTIPYIRAWPSEEVFISGDAVLVIMFILIIGFLLSIISTFVTKQRVPIRLSFFLIVVHGYSLFQMYLACTKNTVI